MMNRPDRTGTSSVSGSWSDSISLGLAPFHAACKMKSMIRSFFTPTFVLTIILSFLISGCGKAKVDSPTNTDIVAAVRISPDGTDAAEPAIAADANGNIFVVYVEHAGKAADVFVQRLDPSGKAAGERVRVNPVSGEAKAWKGDPPTIAVAPDSTIYIGWTQMLADRSAKGNDLMLSSSRDGGRTFGDPVKVNDDAKPASHGMHSLAVDKDGHVYMAWLDERNIDTKAHVTETSMKEMHHEDAEPNSEVYYSVSVDGRRTFGANKKIAAEVCPCCKTSLLAAADGTIYVGWRQVLEGDHRHIAIAHSNDAGQTFSDGVIVSDDNWQINACPVSGAALSSSGDGLLDVLWYTAGAAGQAGTYFARSADGGKTFGSRILVSNEATGGTPVLLERNGEAFAIFTADVDDLAIAKWEGTPATKIRQTKIADAGLPASANSNGKIFSTFVRDAGGKTSVWLTSS